MRIHAIAIVIAFALSGAPAAADNGDSGESGDATGPDCRPGEVLERLELGGRAALDILGDETNLGSDQLEIGVITIHPAPDGADAATLPADEVPQHRHRSLEAFYILSGRLEHIVGDEADILGPGMLAIVKADRPVAHRVVGDEPVKALVVWSPGGEIGRLKENGFETVPGAGCR